RLAVDSFGIEHREIVQSFAAACLSGGEIKPARALQVLRHSGSFFVEDGETELRRCKTLLCRTVEPLGGNLEDLANAGAFGQANANLVLCCCVPSRERGAQSDTAERCRQ